MCNLPTFCASSSWSPMLTSFLIVAFLESFGLTFWKGIWYFGSLVTGILRLFGSISIVKGKVCNPPFASYLWLLHSITFGWNVMFSQKSCTSGDVISIIVANDRGRGCSWGKFPYSSKSFSLCRNWDVTPSLLYRSRSWAVLLVLSILVAFCFHAWWWQSYVILILAPRDNLRVLRYSFPFLMILCALVWPISQQCLLVRYNPTRLSEAQFQQPNCYCRKLHVAKIQMQMKFSRSQNQMHEYYSSVDMCK